MDVFDAYTYLAECAGYNLDEEIIFKDPNVGYNLYSRAAKNIVNRHKALLGVISEKEHDILRGREIRAAKIAGKYRKEAEAYNKQAELAKARAAILKQVRANRV